jgi:hypothetical protein
VKLDQWFLVFIFAMLTYTLRIFFNPFFSNLLTDLAKGGVCLLSAVCAQAKSTCRLSVVHCGQIICIKIMNLLSSTSMVRTGRLVGASDWWNVKLQCLALGFRRLPLLGVGAELLLFSLLLMMLFYFSDPSCSLERVVVL